MLFFSKIFNKQVLTEDNLPIGKLEDFIFLVSSIEPKVTKLLLRKKNNEVLIIPYQYVKTIDRDLTIKIKKNYQLTELEANELYVLRNLLDKQIIDVAGNKLIRVNDVCFQEKDGNLYLIGVEVGILGILRRLGLEDFLLKIFAILKLKIESRFLSWVDIQPLELSRGVVMTKYKENKLSKLLPEDLADYLQKTNIDSARKIINLLDERRAAQIIKELNLSYQLSFFNKLKTEEAIKFIKYLDPDEAVDILFNLSKRKREEIINKLPEDQKKVINYLIKLSKTPIGDLMTTEYVQVKPEMTVRETLRLIKEQTAEFSFLTTVYVVNNQNQLIGVFNLHELLLQDLETPVFRFMQQNLIVVHLSTPKDLVILKMLKYNLQVLPVINEEKQLMGIITIDDLSDYIFKKINK
ncbi:MAG: CBS domain-containing protein [Microgenomates group bacterium]